MEIEKVYIDANELLLKSFQLAKMIWEDGFYPNFLVGIWRGGTPPGIAIQEFFKYKGIKMYHTSIKTQSYTGISSSGPVEVKGLGHVIKIINDDDRLLLVDDVFDSGKTIAEVIDTIRRTARKNTPEIKVAVVYYKDKMTKVDLKPEYYVEKNNDWLVFPHELDGLTRHEIMNKGQKIYDITVDNCNDREDVKRGL